MQSLEQIIRLGNHSASEIHVTKQKLQLLNHQLQEVLAIKTEMKRNFHASLCAPANNKYQQNSVHSTNVSHITKLFDLIRQKNIFIAALQHQNERIYPMFTDELVLLVHQISNERHSNVFVSLHASGTDATITNVLQLQTLLQQLNISYDIQANNEWDKAIKSKDKLDRLAQLRNIGIRYLHKQAFDLVLYLNDIIFCAGDVIDLIAASLQLNADLTCGMDYTYSTGRRTFYDIWVARDINGHRFINESPFISSDRHSQIHLSSGMPFQVTACWNGIVVIPASVFKRDRLRFRSARYPFECYASECELFARDLHAINRSRMVVVPSIQVAYTLHDFKALKTSTELITNASKHLANVLSRGLSFINTGGPKAMECCSWAPGMTSAALWQECFMDEHWRLPYRLLQRNSSVKSISDMNTMDDVWSFYSSSAYAKERKRDLKCRLTADNQSNNRQLLATTHMEKNKQLSLSKETKYSHGRGLFPRKILQIYEPTLRAMTFQQRTNIFSWWINYPCHEYYLMDTTKGRGFLSDYYLHANFSIKLSQQLLQTLQNSSVEDYVFFHVVKYLWLYQYGGVFIDINIRANHSHAHTLFRRLNSHHEIVILVDTTASSTKSISLYSGDVLGCRPGSIYMKPLLLTVFDNIASAEKQILAGFLTHSTLGAYQSVGLRDVARVQIPSTCYDAHILVGALPWQRTMNAIIEEYHFRLWVKQLKSNLTNYHNNLNRTQLLSLYQNKKNGSINSKMPPKSIYRLQLRPLYLINGSSSSQSLRNIAQISSNSKTPCNYVWINRCPRITTQLGMSRHMRYIAVNRILLEDHWLEDSTPAPAGDLALWSTKLIPAKDPVTLPIQRKMLRVHHNGIALYTIGSTSSRATISQQLIARYPPNITASISKARDTISYVILTESGLLEMYQTERSWCFYRQETRGSPRLLWQLNGTFLQSRSISRRDCGSDGRCYLTLSGDGTLAVYQTRTWP